MIRRPIKLAYLVSHPIQYQAPLLRQIAALEDIDLTVFFMSDFSLREYHDREFRASFVWDVPLVDGYKYELLPGHGNHELVKPPNSPRNKGVRERLKRGGFDALWSHGYAHMTSLKALLAAKSLGMKILVRSDNQLGSAVDAGIRRKLKETMLRAIFPRIDGFLAVGSKNRDYYVHYGAKPERVFMMPYSVDNSYFRAQVAASAPKRDELRRQLGLEVGRPIILYASKFTARKRALDLLEAYIRLSVDGKVAPNPYLLFIGDGEERGRVEKRAGETGWETIRFLGFKNQTELPAYFDLCDVFVLVSGREPWGLVVNEVMNAEKAVIVSDGVGAAQDLVKDGVNGFVVPVGDVKQLAARLQQISSSREEMKRMGAESGKLISRWSNSEAIEGLRTALYGVLPREAGTACPQR